MDLTSRLPKVWRKLYRAKEAVAMPWVKQPALMSQQEMPTVVRTVVPMVMRALLMKLQMFQVMQAATAQPVPMLKPQGVKARAIQPQVMVVNPPALPVLLPIVMVLQMANRQIPIRHRVKRPNKLEAALVPMLNWALEPLRTAVQVLLVTLPLMPKVSVSLAIKLASRLPKDWRTPYRANKAVAMPWYKLPAWMSQQEVRTVVRMVVRTVVQMVVRTVVQMVVQMVMLALTDLALWALKVQPMAKQLKEQVKKPVEVTSPRRYLPMLKTKQWKTVNPPAMPWVTLPQMVKKMPKQAIQVKQAQTANPPPSLTPSPTVKLWLRLKQPMPLNPKFPPLGKQVLAPLRPPLVALIWRVLMAKPVQLAMAHRRLRG
jgi:hypothetical protein